MTIDDFNGIEKLSEPSAEQRLDELKNQFHASVTENSVFAAVVSRRLDDEKKQADDFLSGSLRLEPTYRYENDQHIYGISLTRLVPLNFGGVEYTTAQPDPLDIGSPNEHTGGFSLSPRFEDLLRRTGYFDDESILQMLKSWQYAVHALDQGTGKDAAPDPSFFHTYRLIEESESMSDYSDASD